MKIGTLSIRQPWAFLIVNGMKDIENRTWDTAYRGPLLIHTGKTPDDAISELVGHLRDQGYTVPSMGEYDLGGIVGVVNMVEVVTIHRSIWFHGPFGYVLENPRPLPFTPARGHLGILGRDWDDSWGDKNGK